MDGERPTDDELLDLTRRQARQIDELRAEAERLKVKLERTCRRQGVDIPGRWGLLRHGPGLLIPLPGGPPRLRRTIRSPESRGHGDPQRVGG